MVKSSWQEHFKASIKNAENLYSKDSTNVSLLLFCLRSKMIPLESYLEWAKENYQLPVLSAKFFEIHKPQPEFYKKWQETYKWSAECLPVSEWDGALIVACLQIPGDYKDSIKDSIPTVFVLASHEVLNNTWDQYQNTTPVSETDFTDMSTLAATVIATPQPVDFFTADGEVVLQDHSPSEELSAETSEEAEPSQSEGSPEGLFGDNSPAQDVNESPLPAKGPRSVQPLMALKINPMSESVEDPPPPHSPQASTYLLEKVRKEGSAQFDKEMLANFQLLKTFFKKSMLLGVDEKDHFMKPIFWDSGDFDTKNQQNSEFNLETPSIFKIVNSTQKPYHGFVIINDLNESFFESWNHGEIPDHVTIVPILQGESIAGMLMGFGEKSSYNKTVLQFTEKIAKEVSQKLFKNSDSKAA